MRELLFYAVFFTALVLLGCICAVGVAFAKYCWVMMIGV